MTHQMLYEIVRAIVHPDWAVAADYDLRSWAEPQYGVTVFFDGGKGRAFWGDTPEALLQNNIVDILKLKEAPRDPQNA